MTRRAPSLPVIVLSALLVLLLSGQRLSRPTVIVAAPAPQAATPTPSSEPSPEPVGDSGWPSDLLLLAPDYLLKFPLLHTEIPKRPRKEVVTYMVVGGDTIVGIAKRFGISPESVLWANERTELNPEFLRIGQELLIPPTTGVLHEVKAGDTLDAIAQNYKVDKNAIIALEANALTPPFTLSTGQKIMVPGGEKPYTPKVVYGYSGSIPTNATKGSGNFAWPISGVITQQFWTGHRAIDIGARIGSPVVASDNGYVVLVAYDEFGYGKHVIINHGNGFESLYAHLSVILVAPGQSVAKGQPLALSGNTGRSSGPHLHFEIRYLGVQRNPFNYLP